MAISYLLPVSQAAPTRKYDLALREDRSLVIGLLANGFPDADNYLERQAEALARCLPGVTFRAAVKGRSDQLSAGIQEPLLSKMADECDAVLIAWGHCGSCTSGVTRDAISFAERGIPSVTLICDVFWKYSEWMQGALGMTDIPRVQIPYPVSGTDEKTQRELAEQVAPQILDALMGRQAADAGHC